MRPHLPPPLIRAGLDAFRRLPAGLRRRVVHAGAPCYTLGAVLLLRDPTDRILLLRQRHSPGWALPGGLLRHGETAEAAVAREVAEELGIDVDPSALDPPVAQVDAGAQRVDLIFVLRAGSVNPTVDGVEVIEARWFGAPQLPACAAATQGILRRCGVQPSSS